MTDFTNYFEVLLTDAQAAATERLKDVEDILKMCDMALVEEKRQASDRVYEDITTGINGFFNKLFCSDEWLRNWANENPGHLLSMFQGWHCVDVKRAVESVASRLRNLQMNCEREGGSKMWLKQSTHGWVFCDEPWSNIKEELEPFFKPVKVAS